MKVIKYSLIAAAVVSLTSCLKAKSDFGGVRTDAGSILTSISESQYLNTDAQNIQFHFSHNTFATFDLTTPNEPVKMFTLKVTQARDTKVSGELRIRVRTSHYIGQPVDPASLPNPYRYDVLPAGAIVMPADSTIVVPASSAPVFEYPVLLTVNKALLDPTKKYAVTFELLSASQGKINTTDNHINVVFNPLYDASDAVLKSSRINGRYVATTTVVDSAGVVGITNNTRPYILSEGRYNPWWIGGQQASTYVANHIYPTDLQIYALGSTTAYSIYALNRTTGAQTQVTQVVYKIDNTGKVVDVLSRATLASLNPVFDASSPNAFVYTNNNQRELNVKYTIRVTLNSLNRPFTITERYTFDQTQVYFNE